MILYGKLDQENQLIVTENVTWVWNAGSTMISLYQTWELVDCFSYVEIFDMPITLRKRDLWLQYQKSLDTST